MTSSDEGAMSQFQSEREAKEYLIGRITAQAKQQGVPLSDVERKMLYFSETSWALPGMLDINTEFERDYDNAEYEQKIARLVREIERGNAGVGGEEQSKWDDAVVKLSEGDHYLLVLIDLGCSSASRLSSKWLPAFDFYGTGKARPRGDLLRLILVAFAATLIMIPVVFLASWLKNRLGN